MESQIYKLTKTRKYRVESIEGTIYDLTKNYGVNSMMMELSEGDELIVERTDVNLFHRDMFSAILLPSSRNLKIVAISFRDVIGTGISLQQ